jgi:hypothetical protein
MNKAFDCVKKKNILKTDELFLILYTIIYFSPN